MSQAKRFFLKETLSVLATTAIVSGIVYAAAGNISSVQTQTISSGAIMEQGWFQQANDKLVAHDAAVLALSGRIAALEAGGGGGMGGMATTANWEYAQCTNYESGPAWQPTWWEEIPAPGDKVTLTCWQAGATPIARECTAWSFLTTGVVTPSPAGCTSGLLVWHAPTKVELTVTGREASDWPAIGTKYVFGAGGTAFGTETLAFDSGTGNKLWLTVLNESGVTNLQVRSQDFSPNYGGVKFSAIITY